MKPRFGGCERSDCNIHVIHGDSHEFTAVHPRLPDARDAGIEFDDSNDTGDRAATDSIESCGSSRQPIALVKGMAIYCRLEFSSSSECASRWARCSAAQNDENLTKSNDAGIL